MWQEEVLTLEVLVRVVEEKDKDHASVVGVDHPSTSVDHELGGYCFVRGCLRLGKCAHQDRFVGRRGHTCQGERQSRSGC